jgi:hypothetical protein
MIQLLFLLHIITLVVTSGVRAQSSLISPIKGDAKAVSDAPIQILTTGTTAASSPTSIGETTLRDVETLLYNNTAADVNNTKNNSATAVPSEKDEDPVLASSTYIYPLPSNITLNPRESNGSQGNYGVVMSEYNGNNSASTTTTSSTLDLDTLHDGSNTNIGVEAIKDSHHGHLTTPESTTPVANKTTLNLQESTSGAPIGATALQLLLPLQVGSLVIDDTTDADDTTTSRSPSTSSPTVTASTEDIGQLAKSNSSSAPHLASSNGTNGSTNEAEITLMSVNPNTQSSSNVSTFTSTTSTISPPKVVVVNKTIKEIEDRGINEVNSTRNEDIQSDFLVETKSTGTVAIVMLLLTFSKISKNILKIL